MSLGVGPPLRPSMDWPLSREEMQKCALRCYEQEVRAADEEMRSKDAALRRVRGELKELRRASMGCRQPVTPSTAQPATPSTASRCGAADSEAAPSQESDPPPAAAPSGAACPPPAEAPGQPALESDPPPAAAPSGAACPPPAEAARPAPPPPRPPTAPPGPPPPGVARGVDAGARGAEPPAARQRSSGSSLGRLKLRATLARFYADQPNIDATKIVERYAGEGVPDLWAQLALKYGLHPPAAVQWLSRALDPVAPVQWPRGEVPEGAQRVVDCLGDAPDEAEGRAEGSALTDAFARRHSDELAVALGAGDLDAVRALAFRGMPSQDLRARIWRALLLAPGPPDDEVVEPTEIVLDESIRAQVESDAYAIWKDDPFLGEPGVVEAVIEVASGCAARCGRHARGACEMAGLLLFALAPKPSEGSFADAKRDASRCLDVVMEDARSVLEDDQRILFQAGRVHRLLSLYDPELAEMLHSHGLAAIPATRLGAALCTKGGFSLADTARIWDAALADPERFRFCDYVIVALLLLSRNDLLRRKNNPGGVAEALLTAPSRVRAESLLRTAHAVCAFERRCGGTQGAGGPPLQFPPRPAKRAGAERRARSVPRGGAHGGLFGGAPDKEPCPAPCPGPDGSAAANAWVETRSRLVSWWGNVQTKLRGAGGCEQHEGKAEELLLLKEAKEGRGECAGMADEGAPAEVVLSPGSLSRHDSKPRQPPGRKAVELAHVSII